MAKRSTRQLLKDRVSQAENDMDKVLYRLNFCENTYANTNPMHSGKIRLMMGYAAELKDMLERFRLEFM